MRTLVAVLGVVLGASCYAPDLRDCTVSCEAASDCSGDQICGGDHFCVTRAIAGQCAPDRPIDGGALDPRDGGGDPSDAPAHDAATHDDARMADARVTPDAAAPVILHLHDDGMGEITIAGGATCSAGPPQNGDCMIAVADGVAVTLHAAGEGNQVFKQWMGQACSGSDAACTFTPVMPTTDIHAQFAKQKM